MVNSHRVVDGGGYSSTRRGKVDHERLRLGALGDGETSDRRVSPVRKEKTDRNGGLDVGLVEVRERVFLTRRHRDFVGVPLGVASHTTRRIDTDRTLAVQAGISVCEGGLVLAVRRGMPVKGFARGAAGDLNGRVRNQVCGRAIAGL